MYHFLRLSFALSNEKHFCSAYRVDAFLQRRTLARLDRQESSLTQSSGLLSEHCSGIKLREPE